MVDRDMRKSEIPYEARACDIGCECKEKERKTYRGARRLMM